MAEAGKIQGPGRGQEQRHGILREGRTVAEPETEKKAEEWSDVIPDPEEDRPEPYEETYRDGSARHECWAEE